MSNMRKAFRKLYMNDGDDFSYFTHDLKKFLCKAFQHGLLYPRWIGENILLPNGKEMRVNDFLYFDSSDRFADKVEGIRMRSIRNDDHEHAVVGIHFVDDGEFGNDWNEFAKAEISDPIATMIVRKDVHREMRSEARVHAAAEMLSIVQKYLRIPDDFEPDAEQECFWSFDATPRRAKNLLRSLSPLGKNRLEDIVRVRIDNEDLIEYNDGHAA